MRKLVPLALAALVAAVAVTHGAQARRWKSLTIGVEGAFPPFNMIAPDGSLSGYDIDVANEVCRRAKLECKLVAQDWDSQIPSLNAGKFDAVLTMGPNPERRKVIDFTTPYAITPNAFMVSKSAGLPAFPHDGEHLSVDDPATKSVIEAIRTIIAGKTVGAPLSTSQQQFIEETFKGDVTVKTYKSSEQVDLDLLAGRVDAEFNNIVYLSGSVKKPGNEDFAVVGPLLTGSIMATNVCFGLRKDDSDLKALMDKAIGEATADGTLARLSTKWFKIDVSPKG